MMVISELASGLISSLLYDSSKKISRELFDTYGKVYNKAIEGFSNKNYRLNGTQIDMFLHEKNVETAIKEYLKEPNKRDCSNILTREFFKLFSEKDFSQEDANLILSTFFGIIDAEIEKNTELRSYLSIYLTRQIYQEVREIKSRDNELINILKNCRVLFIGDEVSKKSGVKSFGIFIIKTIQSITKHEFNIDECSELRENLHSESAFKILHEELGDGVLIFFEEFNQYRHNQIHNFIADEIKNGKWVFTTNRDNLIEQACKEKKIHLERVLIYHDFDFSQYNKVIQTYQSKSGGFLFKLNGSIDENEKEVEIRIRFETILDNLNRVGDNLDINKKKVLEYFLKNFDLCFMGFDCLDNFSLFPVLKNTDTDKSIFWFNYADTNITEKPIKVIREKKVLEDEIEDDRGNRSRFIKTLCINNILLKRKKFLKITGQWTKIIQKELDLISNLNYNTELVSIKNIEDSKEWNELYEKVDEYIKNIIFGRLWEECLSKERAVGCFEEAAQMSEGINRAKAKQNLARVYDIQYGRLEAETVFHEYEESIKLYNEANIIDKVIQCKLGLANYKRRALEQFNEALNDCKEIEKIINSSKFKKMIQNQKKDEEYNLIQAQYHICVGLVYSRLGSEYLNECENSLKDSLDYRKKVGDVKGEAESENAIGLIKRNNHSKNLKEVEDAIRHLQRSLTINESIGNFIGAARNYRNLGLCYTDLIKLILNEKTKKENYQQAKESYKTAINYWYTMKGNPPIEDKLECEFRLGKLETKYGNKYGDKNRDFNEGIEILLKVDEGWENIGNWHNRVRTLCLLCEAYNSSESYTKGAAKSTIDKIIFIYNNALSDHLKIEKQMKNNSKIYENAVQIINEAKKIINYIEKNNKESEEFTKRKTNLDDILGKLKAIMDGNYPFKVKQP
jgi:tetratricopeptide (TPR) repeat protein